MSLLQFSPFTPFDRLLAAHRDMDRAFETPRGFALRWSPPLRAFRDSEGDVVVRLEVPGVGPESLNIQSNGHHLTISGKREVPAADGANSERQESDGEFSRSIELPEDVDLSKADAGYKHGVLTIRVPKREETKPKQISVQVH